jgi:hypothetical protein
VNNNFYLDFAKSKLFARRSGVERRRKLKNFHFFFYPLTGCLLLQHCMQWVEKHFNLEYFSIVVFFLLRVLQCLLSLKEKKISFYQAGQFFSSFFKTVDKSGFLVEEKRDAILLAAIFFLSVNEKLGYAREGHCCFDLL